MLAQPVRGNDLHLRPPAADPGLHLERLGDLHMQQAAAIRGGLDVLGGVPLAFLDEGLGGRGETQDDLAHLLAGHDPPAAGQVRFRVEVRRDGIGLVQQLGVLQPRSA